MINTMYDKMIID